MVKPHEEIAKETQIGIQPLHNIRAESRERESTVEEWRRLIRSVNEVSPEGALTLANYAATELFSVLDKSKSTADNSISGIFMRTLDKEGLSCENTKAILEAIRDNKVDQYEKADLSERIEKEMARLEEIKQVIFSVGENQKGEHP